MSYGHAGHLAAASERACTDPAHWNPTQGMSPELAQAYRETRAVADRPGWRVDRQEQLWYSAAWIDKP